MYVIADDFRTLHDLNISDRQMGADPTAVAVATLNAMLDTLRRRKSLFLLASTWQSSSGLMGIGDLLVDQLRRLRRDLGVDEQEAGAHNSVEDVYTASGVHGVFSAAVGGTPTATRRRSLSACSTSCPTGFATHRSRRQPERSRRQLEPETRPTVTPSRLDGIEQSH